VSILIDMVLGTSLIVCLGGERCNRLPGRAHLKHQLGSPSWLANSSDRDRAGEQMLETYVNMRIRRWGDDQPF
jgi:hypothetical protein